MEIFSQSPPILEHIFKHLSARDLGNCAQVCQLWRSMSAIELKRRKRISWFLEVAKCEVHNHHEYIPNRYSMECVENSSVFEKNLQEQLHNLRIRPKFCIAFASSSFLTDFERYFPDYEFCEPDKKKPRDPTHLHKRKFLNIAKKIALSSHLPPVSPITFIIAPGIVGSLINKVPVEVEHASGVSGICFPNIPGVEIHHSAVDKRKYNLSDLIPEATKIKCLLAFLTPRGTLIVNNLVQSCLIKEESKVAIGGAIIDRAETLLGSVVAFCGEKVEASSLIIGRYDKTEEKIKDKLKMFQETGLLSNLCYAFMFVCMARGFSLFGEDNYESLLFHSMYPDIPLIGVFGNGEIGVNYFPHVPPESKIFKYSKFTKDAQYLHSYTTVFVLLSIKD